MLPFGPDRVEREFAGQTGYAAVMKHLLSGIGSGLIFRSEGAPSKEPLCSAIRRKVCVAAVHEKRDVRLAPHVVYGSGDNLLVDAVVVEQDGQPSARPRLETFLVSDLKRTVVSGPEFPIHPSFDPGDIKYSGKIVCIVGVI